VRYDRDACNFCRSCTNRAVAARLASTLTHSPSKAFASGKVKKPTPEYRSSANAPCTFAVHRVQQIFQQEAIHLKERKVADVEFVSPGFRVSNNPVPVNSKPVLFFGPATASSQSGGNAPWNAAASSAAGFGEFLKSHIQRDLFRPPSRQRPQSPGYLPGNLPARAIFLQLRKCLRKARAKARDTHRSARSPSSPARNIPSARGIPLRTAHCARLRYPYGSAECFCDRAIPGNAAKPAKASRARFLFLSLSCSAAGICW